MKIGIDISQIVYGTGVSVYTKNLVENLLKIDKNNEYCLFFSSLRQRLTQISNLKSQNQNLNLKTFKIPPTLLEILWNKFHILPVEKFIGEIDVFHSSDWTQPPSRAAKVTTIHDLAILRYPKTFHPKIVAVHKRRLKWVKKECDLIIAVSQATKRDIVELLGIPEEKIRVIYEGVDRKFKVQSRIKFGTKLKIQEVKKKYKISGDYILAFAGSARKNTQRVIEAAKGFQVFMVGQPRVEDADLPALYSGALCLVYPSLYEGFGLPILEAMKCGCPVVTSNVSSLPEIAGNAAVLVNPLDIKDIARGIKEAIDDRQKLIKKGFEQVKQFNWLKCAGETIKVYQEAYEIHK